MDLSQVILTPVVTEKALALEPKGVYIFKVDCRATKPLVKQAIEEFFKVKVARVNLANVKGKIKRAGKRRLSVKRPDWKKAFVKLEADQKIDLFDKKK
ncbi:50S ribosomal protein L23 [Patescibacteria group bacterium]|nr:50S ribosomal protein L23 [Patescibacteria group bacterium]MBU1931280.1 50S ribosomal protein L23 [Patescibacteria group bacterium]